MVIDVGAIAVALTCRRPAYSVLHRHATNIWLTNSRVIALEDLNFRKSLRYLLSGN